jgi:hypothetical protein
MSEDFDHEERDELLETAVSEAFDAVILRAQQRDEGARQFLKDYHEFYLAKGKRTNELLEQHQLCKRTAHYIDETLAADPYVLNAAGNRWSTGLMIASAIATPVLAVTKNFAYAGAALLGAGIMYFARVAVRKGSENNAKRLQLALPSVPQELAPYIKDSRDYMGQELWEYGALSYDELQKRYDERTQRKHVRKKHARQAHSKPQDPQ